MTDKLDDDDGMFDGCASEIWLIVNHLEKAFEAMEQGQAVCCPALLFDTIELLKNTFIFESANFGDQSALPLLMEAGFTCDAGVLRPPPSGAAVTHEQREAIQILCDEWDYEFEPEPKKVSE